MKKINCWALCSFVLAVAVGAALHFLYPIWPNWGTAILAPVNESIWEHGKLIFWPSLAVLLLARDGKRVERCGCLLLAVAGMLALGWFYHDVLGGTKLAFDLILYGLMMAIALLLPGRVTLDHKWDLPLTVLTALLGAAYLIFTLLPPGCGVFLAPVWAESWTGRIC